MTDDLLPKNYAELLGELKEKIRRAQIKAAVGVNRELILLYWEIGKRIVEQQNIEGWGKGTLERLGTDLQNEFPGGRGFSPRNVSRMRSFYLAYPEKEQGDQKSNLPQLVAQLPWGHNVLILQKLKDPELRLWYAGKAVENGWSRAILDHQIDTRLYERQGKAPNNFQDTLPKPQSDLAREVLKDPYNFDFLTLSEDAVERDLERGLLANLQTFLIELGRGFAFVGSQYHLKVGESDFYLDLLFYHLHLRCFVVIDLKVTDFKPEYAGKMNFYLNAVDGELKHPQDQPSIGIIICKTKEHVVAEYSLHGMSKPIGVSEYRTLPSVVKENLPTIEELEQKLGEWHLEQEDDDVV